MQACIVNPIAGEGNWDKWKDYIRKNFKKDIFITKNKEDTKQAARGLASKVNSLIVIGGDGTLSDVINGVMNSSYKPCIGIVPLGTGNAFRHEFGIRNVKDAVEIIKKEKTKEVSVIKINSDMDEKYCMFGGIGWDAEIIRLRDRMGKRLSENGYETLHKTLLSGITGYVIPIACKVFIYRPKFFEAEIDGKKEKFEEILTFLVSVFSHYGIGIRAAPKANVFSENLTATVYPRKLINNLVNFANIYYKINLPARRSITGKQIEIKGSDLPLELDGDYIRKVNYVKFSIVPSALKFFVR